jgi:hypothetical protein
MIHWSLPAAVFGGTFCDILPQGQSSALSYTQLTRPCVRVGNWDGLTPPSAPFSLFMSHFIGICIFVPFLGPLLTYLLYISWFLRDVCFQTQLFVINFSVSATVSLWSSHPHLCPFSLFYTVLWMVWKIITWYSYKLFCNGTLYFPFLELKGIVPVLRLNVQRPYSRFKALHRTGYRTAYPSKLPILNQAC